jgi:hypothetical protein
MVNGKRRMVNGKQNACLKLRSGEKAGSNSLIVKGHLQSGTVVCLKSFTIYNLPFTIYHFFQAGDKIIAI